MSWAHKNCAGGVGGLLPPLLEVDVAEHLSSS